MIYFILEHSPTVEYADSFECFVDFQDLPRDQVEALLATQKSKYDGTEQKILASMPSITWESELQLMRVWTDHICLEYFFPWPDSAPGEPVPPPAFDQPIEERFAMVDRNVLERLAEGRQSYPEMLPAFRIAIKKFK